MFDRTKPTVQLLGRWQPWHEGHTALFQRAIGITGQVIIMCRDIHDEQNPYSVSETESRIHDALADAGYRKGVDYVVEVVPNIVDISYGRNVGYTLTKHELPEEIQAISATEIRSNLK